MNRALSVIAAVALSCLTFASASAGDTLRVITDRTESHLAPLFQYYEKTTGVEIKALYVDKGLLPRLQARPTEADLVITKTVTVLESARNEGVLVPFASKTLDARLKPQFREADDHYFIPSYRARGLYYSKDRVKPGDLSTYADLASPKWKGRISIRSGYHNYNISLFCQMAASEGLDKAKAFIKGLHANLARTPQGNDRAQVRAIHEGKADVSIGNSYYMGLMLDRDDQRPWAHAVNYFFPNQGGKGAYVLCSGVALTKARRNRAGATKFMEFLVDDFAQYYLANALYVYPCNTDLPLNKVTRNLAAAQEAVEHGKFKANFVPVAEAVKHREAIVNYLNEINFDE